MISSDHYVIGLEEPDWDAEIYVATSRDGRRTAIVDHLKRMRSRVDRESNNWRTGNGPGPVLDINVALYEQINASIKLREFDESKDKK